ncbi:hypothetical protein Tco_1202310 [Tanacetum coccineum]
MGRDTVQLEIAMSTISQEYLLEFTSDYGISEGLHPELPGRGDRIVDFPGGKVGVYTKFFKFSNFRIPISQFLFDILGHYQIHLSQLSVIGAAKVSHFEIQCRVLNIIPSVNLFRVFYIPSFNSGWMSFSKRPGKNTPQCYTKPLDSLKNWNNRFFWVDEKVFPTVVDWRISAPKDGMPVEGTYSVEDVALLNTRRTPIQRQPELLLCLVGLSRRYFLGDDVYPTFLYDDGRGGCLYFYLKLLVKVGRYANCLRLIAEMDLFNLISAPNPAAVKTGTRPRAAHEVPLLTTTASRVIDMEDVVATSTSSGTPSAMEKSPLDFSNEDPSLMITNRGETENPVPAETSQEDPPAENTTTAEVVPEVNLEKDVTVMGALVNKRRRKRDTSEMETNATPKVLRTDHASVRHESMIRGGKSLAAMGVGADIPSPMPAQQSMSDPDPLSYARPQTNMSRDWPYYRLNTPGACQDAVDHMVPPGYFSELRHLPNEEFLNQYNINLARKVAMGSQLRLRFEQEVRLLKKAKEKVAKRDQRIHARE